MTAIEEEPQDEGEDLFGDTEMIKRDEGRNHSKIKKFKVKRKKKEVLSSGEDDEADAIMDTNNQQS